MEASAQGKKRREKNSRKKTLFFRPGWAEPFSVVSVGPLHLQDAGTQKAYLGGESKSSDPP
jgi:hypothetical protein